MQYEIITGMWACDLQNSSNLDNKYKTDFNNIIDSKCTYLIEKYKFEILIKQFRGDGQLLVFDPKNIQTNLFKFARDFCDGINRDKEEGKIDSNFYIRTYIHIGYVKIDENSHIVVGRDVDGFCKIVDDKQENRLEVKEKFSSILICTKKCFDFLDDKDKQIFSKVTFGETILYKCEYQPKNLVIKLLGLDDPHLVDVRAFIINEFRKNSVKLINDSDKIGMIVCISNMDERKKIYSGLISALTKVTKKAAEDNWKGESVVLIDMEGGNEKINENDLVKYVKEHKTDKFSNLLAWTDIGLDEFKADDYFTGRSLELKKHPLTENMRIYVHDFSVKKIKQNNVIYFSKINSNCVYIHSFDYNGMKLIKDIAPYINYEQYLRQQLEIGLILSDGVIIHSAEILRTENVYKILKEYEEFISDGSIKILFSSKVNDIKEDFGNYIEEKIREYSISEYGINEATSLKNAVESKERIEQTIQLLCKCSNMYKRDGDGTSNLEELIIKDLKPNSDEVILGKMEFSRTNLVKHNYSLFQLLNAKYVSDNAIASILSEQQKQIIIDKIEQLVNGVISASIVNAVFEVNIPKELREDGFKGWYYALVHRSNYLYAKINTGRFLYMEYLPNLCKGSIFDFTKFANTFQEYINVEGYIGGRTISTIRNAKENWEKFKTLYYNAQLLSQNMVGAGFEESKAYEYSLHRAQEQLKTILERR